MTDQHDDVIKWKHFPRYWPFVRGIHRSPVDSPHKGQWRSFDVSLVCTWANSWVNNRETGDLRRHQADYDVTIMKIQMLVDWTSDTLLYLIDNHFKLLHVSYMIRVSNLPCVIFFKQRLYNSIFKYPRCHLHVGNVNLNENTDSLCFQTIHGAFCRESGLGDCSGFHGKLS